MEANSCSSMEGSLYSTLSYFIYHRGIQEDTWAADRRHHTVCPSLVHVCRYRPWRHHLQRSQNVRPLRQRLHSQRWVRCQRCVFRAEQKLPMTQADKLTAEEVETNVFIDVNIVLLRGEMLIDECCNIWILSSVLYWVLKVKILLKQMDQSLHKYISWIYCSVRPDSILTLICGKQKTWNMARCRGGTKMLYLKSSNTT